MASINARGRKGTLLIKLLAEDNQIRLQSSPSHGYPVSVLARLQLSQQGGLRGGLPFRSSTWDCAGCPRLPRLAFLSEETARNRTFNLQLHSRKLNSLSYPGSITPRDRPPNACLLRFKPDLPHRDVVRVKYGGREPRCRPALSEGKKHKRQSYPVL